jgi:hypothetical protein
MPLSDFASVSITTDSVGLQRAGFGVPLILSPNADWGPERVRSYSSLSEVAEDYATTDPEYLMATALFAQEVKPETIKMGRCALPPTPSFSIGVNSVENSTDYTLTVDGTDYTYTSDGSASNDEIITGLAALIAISGYTETTPGSAGSTTLKYTGSDASLIPSIVVDNPSLLSLIQDHADPGVATDLAAIAVEDNDWYFLLNPFNSKAMALACATYAESNEKLFVAATCDTNNITLALGSDSTTSLMGQLKTSARARTLPIYSPDATEYADCALVGRCGPLDPGSETWHLKTLSGVSAASLTSTHRTNVAAKYGTFYYTVAGVNVTNGGKVSSNEFADVIRFRDWLKAQIAEDVFAALAGADKIPFTDAGVSVIEGLVRDVLKRGIAVGGLADDPAPEVTVPLVADVSSANKTARLLPDVKFTATLAGAIHKTTISGVVSV